MQRGVIRRLARYHGFGFIKVNEAYDLFFHRTEVQGMAFDLLKEGQNVEFEIGLGPKGLKATSVKVIKGEAKNILGTETTEAKPQVPRPDEHHDLILHEEWLDQQLMGMEVEEKRQRRRFTPKVKQHQEQYN